MIVQQRLVKSSWASGSVTTLDSLQARYAGRDQNDGSIFKHAASNICYPAPILIRFTPKKNIKYGSRFRFTCEYGNSFDLVLQGGGTNEEHEHKPLTPVPRE